MVLVAQTVGMVLAFALSLLRGETAPLPMDLFWSVLCGVSAGSASPRCITASPSGGWASWRRSPGVIAALIPVVAGIVLEGVPSTLTLVGIALAIVAVVLVSRVSDASSGPSGLRFALVAGVGIGTFSVFLAQISDGHVFGPLALIRLVEAILLAVVVVVTGAAWRTERRFLPAMVGVGVLDMAGNGFFILAVQGGALAVAAVLSSLYPVTTVILAAVFLRERVTRMHAVGIALAVGAIGCIAAGSA